MYEEPEMQGCEHCHTDFPIEQMTMMEDCWFCKGFVADFQAHFAACDHKWEPHTDSMGDPGQYCSRCSGFVRNQDISTLVKS